MKKTPSTSIRPKKPRTPLYIEIFEARQAKGMPHPLGDLYLELEECIRGIRGWEASYFLVKDKDQDGYYKSIWERHEKHLGEILKAIDFERCMRRPFVLQPVDKP